MQNKKLSPKKTPNKWLQAALLTIFLIVAIGYSLTIPAGEGVDEIPHFHYVNYIKKRRALPIQPMSRKERVISMGHHPPLYYFFGALAISWTDTSDSAEIFPGNPHFVWRENDGSNGWNGVMHFGQDEFPWRGSVLALKTMRFLNIILAMIAIYAIYRSTELLFPEHPWAALGVAAVVAFNPSFIFMSSTVHHDVLLVAIFSLTMWWILGFLTRPERKYDAALAGLLVGAAMLTKLSGLTLALLIGIVFLIQAFRERAWQPFLRRSAIAAGVVLLIAGWWYIRNWLLYGDLLGWQMFLNVHSHMVRTTPYTWDTFRGFLAGIGRTFWGGFGFMHITFPEVTKYLWWLVGLALIGMLVAIVRRELELRKKWAEWLVVIMMLIMLFISFVRFSIATVGAGHARYLFPAAFSVGVLIVAGLNGFTSRRHQRFISIVLVLGFLAYAIWLPLTLVLPKYEAPASATTEQLARTTPINLQLAQGLHLVAYEIELDRVNPGQSLPINLYWQAQGNPAERQDPQVRLEIVDTQGSVLDSSTSWPVPSLSPDVWPTETIYVSETTLKIPWEGFSERLYLMIAPVYPTPAISGDEKADHESQLLTEIVTTGTLTRVELEDTTLTRDEILADQLKFVGFELVPDPVAPAGTLLVNLYWQVLEAPRFNYITFVHLLNEQGELVTQFDRLAGGESTPTTTWKVGEILRDVYPLVIPEDTPPGTYSLQAGMYNWPTLERLRVTIDDQPAGDRIELGTVHIRP